MDLFDPTEECKRTPSRKPSQPMPSHLPPEVRSSHISHTEPHTHHTSHTHHTCTPHTQVEEGNIEYKLKLLNPTASRFEHLVTQMKWRLQEGHGEAIYEIGVADSGALRGLSTGDMEDSLTTLKKMAER